MALQDRIYENLAKRFSEDFARDQELALKMNENFDRAMEGFLACFSKELISDIVHAGIRIEFVPKEWNDSPAEPDVKFIYKTDQIEMDDDGNEYPVHLSFAISVSPRGAWQIHRSGMCCGDWPEERLIEEIQRRFKIIDDSEFYDWPTTKRIMEARAHEEKLLDVAEGLANGMDIADIPDEKIGDAKWAEDQFNGCTTEAVGEPSVSDPDRRMFHPLDPEKNPDIYPHDCKGKTAAECAEEIKREYAPTFRMAPEDTGGVDKELEDEIRGNAMGTASELYDKAVDAVMQDIMSGDEEENEFLEVERIAAESRRKQNQDLLDEAKEANTLGYDFVAKGTNHPPGTVVVPKGHEKSYTNFHCPQCQMNLLSVSSYYYCTYCEKKFSQKIIEVQQNEG